MSPEEELEVAFEEAYQRAKRTQLRFPPDIMLKFYAYYKQATDQGSIIPSQENQNIINAFKLNALLQVKSMSRIEAMKAYIALVNKHIPD